MKHNVLTKIAIAIVLLLLITIMNSAQYDNFGQPLWSPTDNIIAVTNGVSIRLYSSDFTQILQDFELIPNPDSSVRTTYIAWSPNGQMIAVGIIGNTMGSVLQVWDVQTGQKITEIFDISPDTMFAWNLQSNRIVGVFPVNLFEVTIRIYDIPSGELVSEIASPNNNVYVNDIAWSPDGTKIVVVADMLYLLDVQTQQYTPMNIRLISSNETPRIQFSPNGNYVIGIISPSANEIVIFDVTTFELVATLTGHTDRIWSINWVDDYIASVSFDGTTRLWDTNTFQLLHTFETGITTFPSFNPDNTMFVSDSLYSRDIFTYDSETGLIINLFNERAGGYPTLTPTAIRTSTPLPSTATP
jgi:WD40 repeat protein